MTRAAFEKLVQEASERIPGQFRSAVREIAVVVESEPASEQRQAQRETDEELLGLYEGTPRTERAYLPYHLPEKITLFQGPLERLCGNDAECIREEVARTMWHELAHALGVSEERLKELEARRGWGT